MGEGFYAIGTHAHYVEQVTAFLPDFGFRHLWPMCGEHVRKLFADVSDWT